MEAAFSQRGQQASSDQVPRKYPQVKLHLNALESAVDLLQDNLRELFEKLEPVSRPALTTKDEGSVETGTCQLADNIFQIRCRIDFLTAAARERIELLEI